MTLLLGAGADVEARWADGSTARDFASRIENSLVVHAIDAHLRRQLRLRLFDICCAMHAADLPVLVLLECFAWNVATTYAAQHVELPLKLQWRIAKSIRD